MSAQRISIGRTVTYRDVMERDIPAVVTEVVRGRFEPVHLTVFDPKTKCGVRRALSVPRNMAHEGNAPNTRSWRWPERV